MLTRISTVLLLGLVAASGCKKSTKNQPAVKSGSSMTIGGGAGQGGITGTVVETMNAAGYTYLKLATSKGEVWAAVQQTAVKKGQRLTVINATAIRKFKSRSLKRTFEVIYFGGLAGAGGPGMMPKGHPGGGHGRMDGRKTMQGHKRPGAARAQLDKPVAKAPGKTGRTVSELHAQRTALAGKTITVRGKVTKFNANIMGKNWFHLQDGSGKGDDYDLTVTSKAQVKVGDIVLVEGVVRSDKNFGGGYAYKVIVEEAKVLPAK